ncbi:Esterase [Phytophthora ramorum]|uniref:Esterase n=1 Tax=Phytophthora ramorum TaxID=164328 RepID=UPI0030962BB7|nr:Esterase [Phytophthora ramorum]
MGDAVVELGLHTAIIGVLLVHFNVLNLTIPILTVSLVIAYLVLFTGFCFVARSLTTSFVAVPYIAVKLQLKLVSLCFAYAARGFKPIFSEWTLAYELTILMMRYMSVVYGETIVNENTHLMREPFAMHGRMILKSSCRQHNTVPEKLVANGMEHMWMRDPEMKQHRVVVIHFHGGGFCIADPLQDVELANLEHTKLKQILKEKYECDVSVDVLLANYRKAPEFLYPTALNDCFDMYKYVLDHENVAPNHVIFSGDSAGGEMSIANCMRLRKENPELQPAAALCYSPVVDFSETDNDEKTPYCILAANFADNCLATYLRSVTDPKERHLVSPINHSLCNLPPIFLQWGDLERFYEQGLRFKAKAEAEGVRNMEFDILKNMVHDPVMFPTAVSPAAEKAITHACEFAAKHLVTVLRAGAGAEQEPEM